MKQLALIDKCESITTGFLTVLPEHFCITVEGLEGTDDIEINFLTRDDEFISFKPLILDREHSDILKTFGSVERIAFNNDLLDKVLEDIGYYAANTMIVGFEELSFSEGVVPLYMLEMEWKRFAETNINDICKNPNRTIPPLTIRKLT